MNPDHSHNSVLHTTQIGFVLIPQYSMIAFASAVEPLRMANRLSENNIYSWVTISADGLPVTASNGLTLTPDRNISDTSGLDIIFLCGGVDIERSYDKTLLFWIRKLAHKKMPIGAICTGTYLMAQAGVLNGYRATIHWENLASLREQYPDTIVTSELFEIDRDRYTCTGGTAPLDMMLSLIAQRQGSELAASISEVFVCERIRDSNDRQRVPLRTLLGTSQPKLMEAVSLMEANIEEPMSLDELASHVELSRRQLERLFQKYLHRVPTRYYLELRLERARQLLLQTGKSIVDIAFACGFVSAPHFSKCYRDYFSIPPRDERRLRRNPPSSDQAVSR